MGMGGRSWLAAAGNPAGVAGPLSQEMEENENADPVAGSCGLGFPSAPSVTPCAQYTCVFIQELQERGGQGLL